MWLDMSKVFKDTPHVFFLLGGVAGQLSPPKKESNFTVALFW